MRISTKYSVALHILVLLVVFQEMKLTSELLAKSTGSNPVIIRNILGKLKKAGIVDVKRGAGGASLCTDPKNITLWAVFEAVENTPLEETIGIHPSPAPNCQVGANIYTLLGKPYGIIANSIKEVLQSYTLQQILDDYNSIQTT